MIIAIIQGILAGIVSAERIDNFKYRKGVIDHSMRILETTSLQRLQWTERGGESFQMKQRDGQHKTAADILSYPNITLNEIVTIINQLGNENNNIEMKDFQVPVIAFDTVEATCKYYHYLTRQTDEMAKYRKNSYVTIPNDITFNHETFPSFSSEELEKLRLFRPSTLHEAGQIQGITPHTLVYLQNYLSKLRRAKNNASDKESNMLIAAGAGAGLSVNSNISYKNQSETNDNEDY